MVRKILLSVISAVALCAMGFAQNRPVSGVVTNEDGSPMLGVVVTVQGTTTSSLTDAAGRYTISAPSSGNLEFTSFGMEPVLTPIQGRSVVDAVMIPNVTNIDDVIVVAFGQATREAFTGSAVVVGADQISKTQSSNVGNALVGKVAGVQFASPTGRLDAGPNIYVRGYGSFSDDVGKAPLWVVDGVPYEGDVNNINSSDIESITILKDAASNALYGARGANGVIMVTTKRAKAGREAVITFDGKWGVNTRALQTYDVAETAGEFYELHHKALYNYFNIEQGLDANNSWVSANNMMLDPTVAGNVGYNVYTIPEGQNLIGLNGRINPNATEGRLVNYQGRDYLLKPDNWLDEVYKSATLRHEYNVSVAGATDRANIFASLGYLNNTGIIAGSDMNRLTARLRADYQAKKWLKVGATMAYTHYVWNNGNNSTDEGASDGGNVFATAIRMAPIYPIYIRDGNGNIMKDQWGMNLYDTGDGRNGGAVRTSGGQSNQLQDIELNKYISEGNAIFASGYMDFNLYEGLKLTVNGNITLDEARNTRMLNPYYGQFASSGGTVEMSHGRDIAYNLQQLLNYNRTFGGRHNLDLLLGHEMYNNKKYRLGASKSGMWSPDNLELSGAVVDGQNATSSFDEYNNEGYFFRAMYDFDSRYFFSASYRRDASSRFLPKNRWGNFWSVGASWIMSKEEWFNVAWVDMLKLKASYGSQGNDNIPPYLYVDYFNIEDDGNGNPTSSFYRKGNPDITWETNGNFNAGVEFSLWGDRLSGGVDFFNRKTTDMLFQLAVPKEAGYSSMWTNIGDMVNRGVEIELNTVLLRTKDFQWDFSVNMSHLNNKIVRLPDQYKNNTTADGKVTGRVQGNRFIAEGYSMFAFYIPTTAGIDPETGKQQWYYWDTKEGSEELERKVTDDPSIANGTQGRELHGDPHPDLYGGFSTSLRWRGLDFSAAFTYQIGGQVIDSGYQFYMNNPSGTSTGNNYHRDLYNSWTPGNPNSKIPRFAYNDYNRTITSDRFLTDASYINIQNIMIGYTIPNRITKKFLVESLRVYLVCDNVWYKSKRQGLDPRQSVSGATNPWYYAPIRTFSGGVSVSF